MLNRFQGALSTLAGAAAGPGTVAAQLDPGARGTAREWRQKPIPWPIRARRTLGRNRPREAKNQRDVVAFTSRIQMTTHGSVSTTDWQGGKT